MGLPFFQALATLGNFVQLKLQSVYWDQLEDRWSDMHSYLSFALGGSEGEKNPRDQKRQGVLDAAFALSHPFRPFHIYAVAEQAASHWPRVRDPQLMSWYPRRPGPLRVAYVSVDCNFKHPVGRKLSRLIPQHNSDMVQAIVVAIRTEIIEVSADGTDGGENYNNCDGEKF